MPDSSYPQSSATIDPDASSGTDANRLSLDARLWEIRGKFIGWTSDWQDTQECMPFPLRDLAPDVVDYLVEFAPYSARDRKNLAPQILMRCDPSNERAFYDELLDLLERGPWVAPYLDQMVALARLATSKKITKSANITVEAMRRLVGPILPKLSIERLRIANRPEMDERLAELIEDGPVPPDIATAVFYEYALHHYLQIRTEAGEHPPLGYMQRMLQGLLAERDAEAALAFSDEFDKDDPRMICNLVEELVDKVEIRPLDAGLRSELVNRALDLADLIRSGRADGSAFDLLGRLAAFGAACASSPAAESSDEVSDCLATLGFPLVLTSEAQRRFLVDPEFRVALALLSEATDRHAAAAAASDTARSAIHEATNSGRFSELADLGQAAQTAQADLNKADSACSEARQDIEQRLKAFPAADEAERDLDATKPSPPRITQSSNTESTLPPAIEADTAPDADPVADPVASQPDAGDNSPIDPDALAAEHEINASTVSTLPLSVPTEPQIKIDTTPLPTGADEDRITTAADTNDPVVTATLEDASARATGTVGATSAAAARAVDENLDDVADAISHVVLAGLLGRGLLGLAADAAAALEAEGSPWPLSSAVLRTAAAARAPQRDYGTNAVAFSTLVETAVGVARTELDSVMMLGSILQQSVIQNDQAFRKGIGGLAQGRLGQHLVEVVDLVGALPYDFPPSADDLARLSGSAQVPQRERLAQRLAEWCETISRKSSRWRFATSFMHHVVSPEGPIGAASMAISAKSETAMALAREAIAAIDSPSKIEALSAKFRESLSMSSLHLFPRGVDKLNSIFSEAISMLQDWLRSSETANRSEERNDDRYRAIIGKLKTRIGKATVALRDEARTRRAGGHPLDAAIADWLVQRCTETSAVLLGGDSDTRGTLDEALTGERDLLPAELRSLAQSPRDLHRPFLELLNSSGIPEPEDAFATALEEGAFETAQRLADRFSLDARPIHDRKADYVKSWTSEVEQRQRSLKALAKVDYAHQEEISRRLTWCTITLDRLASSATEDEVDDLSDVPEQTRDCDSIIDAISEKILVDQLNRIRSYRNDTNADDADELIRDLGTISPQMIEDRISQLRDGRSSATFEAESGHLIAAFTPDFVAAAATNSWPDSVPAYKNALNVEGPLFTEEDRRDPAMDLISSYVGLAASMISGKPTPLLVRTLFERLGFTDVHAGQVFRSGSSGPWKAALSAKIISDGWFLPPIFGSKAEAGYALVLAGPKDLPETIKSALDPSTPSIVVLSGVADISRRREFAQRFRAAGLPLLLIDEALVAFCATRRDTRLRTLFECGLPYGRIEPYITDAGQMPPEMFFGRAAEISAIMSKTADGCLVFGGRQLGKSALLNHVAKVHHDPDARRIVVSRPVKNLGDSEETSAVWSTLSTMLQPSEVTTARSRTAEEVGRDIKSWLNRNPGGQILCLLDEADKFMAKETKLDYPEITRLKDLMEYTGRSFKVVFAGLHNVQRMFVQPNSPLAHLGNPICIGPLNRTQDDKRAANELVVAPMNAAGFRFADDEAPEAILSWANYYPSLVQEYSKGLLATLNGVGSGKAFQLDADGPLWKIPTSQLFEHHGFLQIETRVRTKFHYTLELDPRYSLVAYTLAWLANDGDEQKVLVKGFRPQDLLEQALTFWPKTAETPQSAAFEALLDEMFNLGILGRIPIPGTKRYSYCLASRQVAAMLGSKEDVWQVLLQLEQMDPSLAYDRTIHRKSFAPANRPDAPMTDWIYSPLTDLQIERLVGADGGSTKIVCGLDILGLEKIPQALLRLTQTTHLPGVPARRTHVSIMVAANSKELRRIIDEYPPNATSFGIVLFTPTTEREARNVLGYLDKQIKVLSGDLRPILLFDAANPRFRDLAISRSEDAVWLAAWGAEMLRVHLHNIESNLDSRSRRELILGATGGIPAETIKLVSAMQKADDPDEVARVWSPRIANLETITKGALGRALMIIDEPAKAEDYKALGELIRDHVGVDLDTIGSDLLAMGLISGWNPKASRIRRSALGNLIAKSIDE